MDTALGIIAPFPSFLIQLARPPAITRNLEPNSHVQPNPCNPNQYARNVPTTAMENSRVGTNSQKSIMKLGESRTAKKGVSLPPLVKASRTLYSHNHVAAEILSEDAVAVG